MSKSMLVNVVNAEESRIAIVADGRLEELSIETAQQAQIEGNIYKARIVKIIASLDAVFVDYGRERNGFLAAPDIHASYFRGENKRDVDALHKGQELLVQVKKGEIGQKGAALTTYVSLPGRHFVLMPQVSKRGVSRKIDDDATRKQLRKILDDTGIPEEMGYIARTAAAGRTKPELTRDANYLLRLWKSIQARAEKTKAPALLYEETDIVIRTLRDYFTPAIEEVLIDDEEIFRQVEAFFHAVMPHHSKRLKLHQAQAPLFSKYNLEDQIASIYDKKVLLPSGGSLVIEQTEALVSIDVNSGKTTSGKDIEETAFIANKEAAEEAARQLRLRDMGGLIVIDFIDMRPAKNRSEVRRVLQKALKEDKARTDTGTISKFGLLELSRQRLKGVARARASQPCPVCSGLGQIRSPESSALSVLRRIQLRLPRKGAARQVLVGVPGPVALLLQNRHRSKLQDLESSFGTEVLVFTEEALAGSQFYLDFRIKDRAEVETNLGEGFNRARLRAPQGLPDAPQRVRRASPYPLLEDEPEAIEVPSEPETEADTAAEANAGAETKAAAEPSRAAEEIPATPKKRRRRRRRGRGGNRAEGEEHASEQGAESLRRRSGDPGLAAAETAAAEADAEAAELAAELAVAGPRPLSPAAKRRQRRRRATDRPDPELSVVPAEEGALSDALPVAAAAAAALAPVEEDAEETAAAPKRPRRRRRHKARPSAAGDTLPETPVEQPEALAPTSAVRVTPAGSAPAAMGESLPPAPATPVPPAAPMLPASVAAEPTPAPRRPRKKAAPAAAQEDAGPVSEAAKKPVRKPRAPKAAAPDAGGAPAGVAEPEAPRKPARKPRAPKAVVAEATAPDAGGAPAGVAEPETPKKPARKPRAPKAVVAEATAPDAGGVPAGVAEPETPRKPARKPRVPKVAVPETGDETPAPRKAPRRKTPAQSAVTAPTPAVDGAPAEAVEPAVAKKPARRRRAPKVAAAGGGTEDPTE